MERKPRKEITIPGETKSCNKCNITKPLYEFRKHPRMKDGYRGQCKECCKENNKKYCKKYYLKNRELLLLKKRVQWKNNPKIRKDYYSQPKVKKKHTEQTKEYRKNNPKKHKAQYLLQDAVKRGKIKKQPCVTCGTIKNIHAHHDDYSKPLDVEWLCALHHSQIHRRTTIGKT